MDFTDWYFVDPTCFVYKRPKPLGGVFSLIFPLENEVWLAIAIMLLVVNLFYLLYTNLCNDAAMTFGNMFMYETAVVFRVSHDMTFNIPKCSATLK